MYTYDSYKIFPLSASPGFQTQYPNLHSDMKVFLTFIEVRTTLGNEQSK